MVKPRSPLTASLPDLRASLAADLDRIIPLDPQEVDELASVRAWVTSGAPLLREQGGTPSPHLVSYCCVIDGNHILLGHHRKAGLWLPPGGHVDPGETPIQAAQREISEELGAALPLTYPHPVMATRTTTIGAAPPHDDVTFWYVFQGNRNGSCSGDPREFHAVKWFNPDACPRDCDPKMHRLFARLRKL